MSRNLYLNYVTPAQSLLYMIQMSCTLLLWLTCIPIAGYAQTIAPITPSGLNTQVHVAPTPPAGKVQYDITGGTRPGGGTNVFHSFGEFNVPNNNIANFLNDSGLATSNILGRVTSGNISNIFGTIQTTGFGNANLFMMNPAGFLFGPNATVNVGGMVAFTSADYLRLADGKLFNAAPNLTADTLLSTAPVAAYGFLGSNPGAITVQGSRLIVTPGISLVGGDITIQSDTIDSGPAQSAKLSAAEGKIYLASVASPGEILSGTLALAPNINGQSFSNLGTVQISEQSVIDVSGNGGGTVLIRGGNFVLDNSTISANITGSGPIINGIEITGGGIDIQVSENAQLLTGSLLQTNVAGNATPGITYGSTHIKADRIEIIGDPAFDFENGPFTEIRSNVDTGSTGGNSGFISLEANSILLQDFVTLGTSTNGAGNAGHIKLQTNENLELNGSILETISLSGPGNAGNIELLSAHGNIFMTNGPIMQSQNFGTGNVGHLAVTAPEGQVLLSNFDIFAGAIFIRDQGTAGIAGTGGIQITAKDLTVISSGIQIDNFTSVQPGELDVNVTGILNMSGTDVESTLLTTTRGPAQSADLNITAHDILLTGNSLVSTASRGSGSGGQLNISTNTLQIKNGSRITSDSGQGVDPLTLQPVTTSGSGGSISIQGLTNSSTESILIDGFDTGIFTDTQGTGAGGNIVLNGNTVTLQNGGTLSATTSGNEITATGGTITVNANQVQLNNQAPITATSSGAGEAGTIRVTAAESIALLGNSSITSSAEGIGNGGLVSLTATSIQMHGNSNIGASTRGPGNAGNIELQANQISLTESFVTARTEAEGQGGNITIRGINGIGSSASDVTLSSSQLVGETIGDGINTQGNAGNILIETARLTLKDTSQLNTASRGSTGTAGDIVLNAPEQLIISSSIVNSDSIEAATGDGGQITITSPKVLLENNSSVSTSTEFTGNSGNITINTNSLQITSGGELASSSKNVVMEFLNESPELAEFFPITGPAGKAGTVTVQGLNGRAESVLVDGFGSGIFTEAKAEGEGGNIFVNANSVTLQNGGTLSAATSGSESSSTGGTITVNASQVQVNSGGLLTASTTGAGSGGSININAGSSFGSNAGTVSSTATQATGGDINISAGQSVTLDNGSVITASSSGEGNAGNIQINAGQQYRSVNSSVTTKAEQASGGNIAVLATGLVHLTNSEINASVEGSTTTVGGNILIDPVYVILENSQILAQATQGQGGNINIFYTGALLADPSTFISASSQFGQQGTVTIQSPISPASGKIIPLGQKPLIPATLLSQRCAALAGGSISSFTVAGRDGLPAEPGNWLSTPLALSIVNEDLSLQASSEREIPLLSLRQISPPGFLTQSFPFHSAGDCIS